MRLATLRIDGEPRAAVLCEQGVHLVGRFEDVGALLRDSGGLDLAKDAADAGDWRPFEEDSLLQPVLSPGAVVCVGLNYRDHILEMGRELPVHPTLFSKLPRALTHPFAEIAIPRSTTMLDYEAEVAIVIGRAGSRVPRERAWEHVAGLTLINDVTARDLQRRTVQWFAGKTLQESSPIGPWVVTPEELGDVGGLELRLTVNGELRQAAKLDGLVFDVPALVADLSEIFTLEPGDVIATGTPGGVGDASGRLLKDGDVVEVSMDGIGRLRNVVRDTGRLVR